MKKAIILIGFLYLVLVFACRKTDTDNLTVGSADSIVFSNISKTQPSEQRVGIPTLYNYLYFNLGGDNISGFNAAITQYVCLACNQGFQEILTDDSGLNALPLGENFLIDDTGKWNEPLDCNLIKFAGNGELYIGFRSGPPINSDNKVYNYGWVKVELSKDKSNIKIISSAINMTPGNPIKSGQVK
ncbi:MAG: hypothetical protein WC780_16915 [Lentimicrobiaceae bacterium]|jgi:hypothetical protein